MEGKKGKKKKGRKGTSVSILPNGARGPKHQGKYKYFKRPAEEKRGGGGKEREHSRIERKIF